MAFPAEFPSESCELGNCNHYEGKTDTARAFVDVWGHGA